MNTLTISPSPHVHSGDSVKKNMYWVIIALLPALAASFFYFGIGAIIVTLTAVLSCVIFEFLISKYILKTEPTIGDGSVITSYSIHYTKLYENQATKVISNDVKSNAD